MKLVATYVTILVAFIGCDKKSEEKTARLSHLLQYSVLSTLPHDDKAFTEGLVTYNDKILESTGQHNQSWVAEVNQGTGQSEKKVILDGQYFGEGITVLNHKIYHLTYKEKVGFIYDAKDYKRIGEFSYSTEGWGITHDTKNLIMSDGTAYLRFLDRATQKETGRVQVRDAGVPVEHLNELEYVKGEVFANVWQTDRIVRISPKTGRVTGWIDLGGLLNPREAQHVDVLNGIAYDAAADRLFVTGKLWPKLFEIVVVAKAR